MLSSLRSSGARTPPIGSRSHIRRERQRGTPALFDAPPMRVEKWPIALDPMSAEPLPGGIVRLRCAVQVSRS